MPIERASRTKPTAFCSVLLVVAAPTLEAGAAWVADRLGAACRPGGAHTRMGTHNVLLRFGPAIYLEVIAIDPATAPPDRPR
jgi:hypothetical protein